jgi:thiol-disulfide isomerase/thioredoxin
LIPSDYYTGISLEEALKQNKPIVACFYVDWCKACRKFMPMFDSLRKEYNSKYNFAIVKSDDPVNEKLVKEFNISFYPSVFLINKKNKKILLKPENYMDRNKMTGILNDFVGSK